MTALRFQGEQGRPGQLKIKPVNEAKEHTIVSKEVGEHSLQILVVGEAIQGLLQTDGHVLEAGEQTEQTHLVQEDHQGPGQRFQQDKPVEAAHGTLKTKHNHHSISLSLTVPDRSPGCFSPNG